MFSSEVAVLMSRVHFVHIITNTKERSCRSLVCPYSYLIEKARCRSRTGKVTMTGMAPVLPAVIGIKEIIERNI